MLISTFRNRVPMRSIFTSSTFTSTSTDAHSHLLAQPLFSNFLPRLTTWVIDNLSDRRRWIENCQNMAEKHVTAFSAHACLPACESNSQPLCEAMFTVKATEMGNNHMWTRSERSRVFGADLKPVLFCLFCTLDFFPPMDTSPPLLKSNFTGAEIYIFPFCFCFIA